MSRADGQQAPPVYPSVVVADFGIPEAIQATLAELHSLGLPAHDVRVVNAAIAPTFAGEPLEPLGWWQRLNNAARSAMGQPQRVVSLRDRMVQPAAELVVVVQTIGLPIAAIVEVCRRHGARQVHSRRVRPTEITLEVE